MRGETANVRRQLFPTAGLRDLVQTGQNLAETVQSRFEVLDDFLGKVIRLWQVIEVSKTFVF